MPNFIDELKLHIERQEDCGATLDGREQVTLRFEDGERFDRCVYSFKLKNHPNGAQRIYAWQVESSVGEKETVYRTALAGPRVRDGEEAVRHALDQIKRSL